MTPCTPTWCTATSARHEHDVGCQDILEHRVGDDRERAVFRALHTRLGGGEPHGHSGHALEHLVRPDRVERGHPVEQQHGKLCRYHAVTTPSSQGRP